jgi:hypothetical protein
VSPLTRLAAGRYRHDRLGVEVEKTAMPHMPWQLTGPDPDDSGVVHARTLGDARAFLREIEQHTADTDRQSLSAAGATEARRALLQLHRYLFPERYDDVATYEWHAGTIEDVAAMLERALAGEPDAQLSAN